MQVSCLASTLKMEVTCSTETSVYFQRTTRRYVSEFWIHLAQDRDQWRGMLWNRERTFEFHEMLWILWQDEGLLGSQEKCYLLYEISFIYVLFNILTSLEFCLLFQMTCTFFKTILCYLLCFMGRGRRNKRRFSRCRWNTLICNGCIGSEFDLDSEQ
jgi:hypothetical protein